MTTPVRIIIVSVMVLQSAFAAEYFGDRVWYDLNKNGLQDAGEPGVSNVSVRIGWSTVTTDANGYWRSNDLRSGRSYTVTFSNIPAGYVFTLQNQGGDDALDSDASPVDGVAGSYTAIANTTLDYIDAGIYLPVPEIDLQGNGVSIFDGKTYASIEDDTYFGSADIVTGLISHTFTIVNEGDGSLDLTGSPLVEISGTNASDFSVISQPSQTTIDADGGTETFVIRFDPSASGIRTATVTINSSDSDEGSYTFSVLGNGTAIPEIDILGNGNSIPDGDTSPSLSDFSDFGDADIYGGANTQTFSIYNSGSGVLSLTGNPIVQITGAHSSNFTVSQQPTSNTISDLGGSQTFQITFDPSTTGLRQASVYITSDDANESPYTFAIQGTGTINPEIDIQGNNNSIPSGSSSPASGDSTYFGTADVGGTSQIRTYTIFNTGPATLNLTGPWPLVSISGLHSGDFSVYTAPASSIAPGNSTTFQLEFDPIAAGSRYATLTIENNDLNEFDYSFSIEGLGAYTAAPLSEIGLRGSIYSIPDGDSSPNQNDGTDFGSVAIDGATKVNTFSIDNVGSEDLVLTSFPAVTVNGSHASEFSITQQPSSPVAPGGTVTFNVSFDPAGAGIRSAYLSIENNDSDENPYTFTIQGSGLASPEIEVRGNGLEIVANDATPSLTDSTYFGEVTASLGESYVTYTINNLGSTTLNLTGAFPVAITGDDLDGFADEFTVITQPSSSIAANSSSTFVIKFDPSLVGLRNAAVSIASDDSDELTYLFAIQGNGTGPGSPLACVPNFFHIFGDNGTITYLDASTTPYSYTTIVEAGYSINGMGYNLEDGLLYGFEMDTDVPGNNIVRIDGQGTISVLSSVSIPYESWRADFNNSGEMYFWNSNGTEISIFDADLGTVTSHTSGGTAWIPIDMAYLDSDGLFYGIHTTTLYIYDPSNHNVSTKPIVGRLADEYATGTNSQYYGAAWSANDGYLYSTNSQSGRMYKINVHSNQPNTDAESVFVGQAEANLNKSDGASCPLSAAPLPATGSIGNDVWIDADGDGIQDASETGLPGVTVDLYTIDGTYISTSISDANGEYGFQNLSPSEYYMIFSGAPAGFVTTDQDVGTNDLIDSDIDFTTGQTDNFIVGVGLQDEGIDAGYTTTGVGNFVWNDLNQNGDQDLGEPGVPGITINLYDGTQFLATTTSDADGFYAFSGVSVNADRLLVSNLPGGYVFTARNSGASDLVDSDINQTSGESDVFTLSGGIFNATVDIGIYQNASPEINVKGLGNDIPDGDTSPGTTDGTDFGFVLAASGTAVKTFTVENLSGADLSLNGSPVIEISGSHATDFSISSAPATTVSSGSNTSFQVTFDPSGGGLREAVLSITNNDNNENPYDFNIQGTGLAPEIQVSGNALVIADGDTTASTTDNTDFGDADIVTGQTFVVFSIENIGSADLLLTDPMPYVSFSGDAASDFSLQINPATPISAGNTSDFTVRFNPSAEGLRVATLSIANSDTDENPYTFEVQGNGTSYPEIEVKFNTTLVADGDTSPSTSDSTNFGSRDVSLEQSMVTYSIHNIGSGDLDLTSTPIVQIYGANAGDFVVAQQPLTSTIGPNGSRVFKITFDPTTTGVRSATVSIANTDNNENPYTFAIEGLGTSTLDEEMEVLGNGNIIDSGDDTPGTSDFTDLGETAISVLPSTSQFVIKNIGYAILHLTGPPPYVSIGGTHASEFIITNSPSNSVGIGGGETTFEVGFNPAGLGVRQAIISIQNDDSDENPYTFTIQGTGIYDPNSQSEANVSGNMIDIADGDTDPASADGTDFGNVEVVGGFTESQEFVVHNLGTDDLVLGSTPMISISGTNASDFSIIAEPASLVAPYSSVAFTVSFDPSGTGLRTATVNIGNSDPDENPYTFDIQGTGTTAPEISVSGNGYTITNGDDSPSTSDSTNFGDVDVSLGFTNITYTVYNNGSSGLILAAPLVSISGTNSSEFTVASYPSASIPVGGNTSFVIQFDALAVGTRSAVVTIASNDPDTPTYTFDIQGYGTGSGSPLSCEPNFFQVYGPYGTIAYLDASTSPYTYTTLATAGYVIDGIGYNMQDGLIYGFEHNDSGWPRPENMVRIDATGAVTILTAIDHDHTSTVADFDNSGNYYFWDASGTDLRLFDASEGTVTGNLNPSGTWLAQDMAFRSLDGQFYGVHDSSLYVYNIGANSVSSSVKIRGKLQEDIIAGTNSNVFGSAWTASDGYLYVANEGSGRMYKVDVSTNPATSVYVGQASIVANSDGASCPIAPSPLPTTGTIGDKVWLDNNGDGIQDAGEEGLAGVTVSIYEANDTFLSSVITGEDGLFSFGSLGASEYYLTFTTPPAGFSLSPMGAGSDDGLDSDPDPTTGKTANIEITPGVVNNSIDAGFSATGIGDYVWLDVNEDGLQTSNENGVPGIDVEIKIDGGASVATTTTDAEGKYSFTGLSANTYRLYFTGLPIGYDFTSQNQGSDDNIDNDIGSNGQSAAIVLGPNAFNNTIDAGVFQSSEPEMNVTGNGTDIIDGDVSPSTVDDTDFGSVSAGVDSVLHTFTIENAISGATLTLNGTPRVAVTGSGAADFVVKVLPAETVTAGSNTTFDIRFIPTAEGLRTATITIPNTDANENPYDFTVRGFGLASEIQIEGNGQAILDGDDTPTATDFTDFGSEDILSGSQAQIFTILNTGNANLVLSDPSPHVTITGDHAADFSITSPPASPVASNSTTTFTITFDPEAEGLRTAVVTIANNDLSENPYTYTIQGIGLASPEITVEANNELVADGDTSPISTDNTDFGSKDILSETQTHTFNIINTGSGTLSFTSNPIVALAGGHAGDFFVSAQPTGSTVAPGDTLTFDVDFDPTSVGLRSASVSIANDDEDENPFDFSIQGTGVASSELEVTSAEPFQAGPGGPYMVFDSTIVDSSTSLAFTITNSGSAVLNLTAISPYVIITGANAGDFAISEAPSSAITAGGGTTQFIITFTPQTEGDRVATISIPSDDESTPYVFEVRGFGQPMPLPELSLVETVDLSVAVPGDTLTYTVVYSNVGEGQATAVVIDQDIPDNSTFVPESADGIGMTIKFSNNNGSTYLLSEEPPITNIKYERTSSLPAGGNGTVTFKVIVD